MSVGKTAVFTFGRFQPPTLGHGVLFRELASVAQGTGADAFVFVSSTQDKKKNPLPVDRKVYWLEHMYSDLPIQFVNTTTCTVDPIGKPCKTIFQVMDALRNAGYAHLHMYVGSDRVPDFTAMLSKYAVEGVEPVIIIGAGNVRNESRGNLAGMSGTKMRNAAARRNIASFVTGTGFEKTNATLLMDEVRAGMGLVGGKHKTQKLKRTKRSTRKYRDNHV